MSALPAVREWTVGALIENKGRKGVIVGLDLPGKLVWPYTGQWLMVRWLDRPQARSWVVSCHCTLL